MKISPTELTALGVGSWNLWPEASWTPEKIDRMRFGGHIVAAWTAGTETEEHRLSVPGHAVPLILRSRRYTSPPDPWGNHDTAEIGALSLDEPLRVTESYAYYSQTNSGGYHFDADFTSPAGVCCDELLRALKDGAGLEPGPDHTCTLVRVWRDDVIWHDSDWKRRLVRLTLDLASRSAVLRRVSLFDCSQ